MGIEEPPVLNEACFASLLNRSARVQPGGQFALRNIPVDRAVHRVRFTCTFSDGTTVGAQSAFLRLSAGTTAVEQITFENLAPIPAALSISASSTRLLEAGARVQLLVTGTFQDGVTADLTQEASGTTYTSSNPGIAALDPFLSGSVIAASSGTAVIAAMNEGAVATVSIEVRLSADGDGDGMPDDYERRTACLSVATPDAFVDSDADGLVNFEEFSRGTDPCVADTDGDGLSDSLEVTLGSSPVLPDSDLDGLLDGLEPGGDADGDGLLNVRDRDSDNDGLVDGFEVRICGTAFCAGPQADADGDGLGNLDEAGLFTDPVDPDSDDDGLGDGEEAVRGTDPLVPDRTPPTVAFTAPGPGNYLVEGEILPLSVAATDDGRVVRMDYLLNGSIAASSSSPPFAATITLPINLTTLTLEAAATDTNGNVGRSGVQAFPVVDDPLAALTGRVVDTSGVPIPGALVTARLPLVPVETGALEIEGGPFVLNPSTRAGTSTLSGTLSFDPGVLPLLGEAVDLRPAGTATVSGTLELDLTGFQAQSPTPREGSMTLSGVTSSGVAFTLQGPVSGFTPAQGQAAFLVDLSLTAFDAAGLPLAAPLTGRPATARLLGTAQVTTDPLSHEVTSLTLATDFNLRARLDYAAVSGSDGTFSIPSAPTIFGDVVVDASLLEPGGVLRRGASGPTPFVRGGTSVVDDITIRLLPRARRDYPLVGNGPLAMAAGDVNRDGFTDFVTAQAISDSLSVLLGREDGTLAAALSFPAVGSRPRGVAIGDLNGDGAPDLAVANENSHSVTIYLGGGDGTFQAAQAYPVGLNPGSIIIGRLDGDSNLDVVTSNFSSENVSVLLGLGDGTFQAARNFRAGVNPSWVTIAYLDGDAAADLAVTNWNADNVSILLGRGDGTFQDPRNFPVRIRPGSVGAADFNRDGLNDLAVANQGDQDISILIGNGDGTFQPAHNYFVGSVPLSLSIGEVSGDQALDIVVPNQASPNVGILRGVGDGTFLPVLTLPTMGSPAVTAIADLNRDGQSDVAATVGGIEVLGTDFLSVFISRGDAVFEMDQTVATHPNPRAFALGNLDGDSNVDLAVVHAGSADVLVLASDGQGGFRRLPDLRVNGGTSIDIGDFDRDGANDLAVADFLANVWVPAGNGDGTFLVTQQSLLTAGSRPTGVAIGDLNADGNPDLAVANRDSDNLSVLLGRGNLTFQPARNFPVGSAPIDLAISDLNRDGRLDLAVVNNASGTISTLVGNGDGSLQSARSFSIGANSFGVEVGDFNLDGIPDVAAASKGTNSASVLIGAGDGTFHPALTLTGGDGQQAVDVGDIDGDGTPDLAVVNSNTNNIGVYLGRGDGTFRAPAFYGVRSTPVWIAIEDLNRDGLADLLVSDFNSSVLSVLFGRGRGSF